MQIRPTTNAQRTQAIKLQSNSTGSVSSSVQSTPLPVDQLEISPQAQMINAAANGGEVRMQRVAEVRAQIANGNYDTAEKMDAALGRLLDQFA